jgi:hypothetical protein
MSAYAAVKAAAEVLTRYQAAELAERSIRVNAIMGGAVETGFADGVMRSDHVKELAAQTIIQGRIATVDDITTAVPAILSDAFQWATGSVIDVSGGRACRYATWPPGRRITALSHLRVLAVPQCPESLNRGQWVRRRGAARRAWAFQPNQLAGGSFSEKRRDA